MPSRGRPATNTRSAARASSSRWERRRASCRRDWPPGRTRWPSGPSIPPARCGPAATITFVLSTAPPVADPPVLAPASDTGRSTSDRITAVKQPVFNVTGAATDLIQLLRNGKLIASRTGPGPLQDPGVSTGGSYSYTLTRTSLAGPTSTSKPTVVTIDTTPPAAVGGLTALTNGKVQFRATQSTDVYEYRVGTSGPYQPLGNATSFTPTGLVVGRNQVYVHAVDLAGNIGPNATVVITVAQPAPVTASWIGQDGAITSGRVRRPVATAPGHPHRHRQPAPGPRHRVADHQCLRGRPRDYNVPSSRNWSAAVVRTASAHHGQRLHPTLSAGDGPEVHHPPDIRRRHDDDHHVHGRRGESHAPRHAGPHREKTGFRATEDGHPDPVVPPLNSPVERCHSLIMRWVISLADLAPFPSAQAELLVEMLAGDPDRAEPDFRLVFRGPVQLGAAGKCRRLEPAKAFAVALRHRSVKNVANGLQACLGKVIR